MLSNRSFCNCLFVSVRVFPISQTDTKKKKKKKIHYTYISKCKESLAPYGAIAVIAIYNLIRNRLISPIIIRARLELDLIKSCVSNTKDQFGKSVYNASPMYSCVYPYTYVYIYNIFCSLIYIYVYISNPTKFFLTSLVYSYAHTLLWSYNSQFFFLFFLFFFFFFLKAFRIRRQARESTRFTR